MHEEQEGAAGRPVYRLVGNLGILNEKLRDDVKDTLRQQLKLESPGWRDKPPTTVSAYFDDGVYFWVPRYFIDIKSPALGNHPVSIEWTEGREQSLPLHITLDPKRGQPIAVDRMEQHLRDRSGGILVAPTGCGKTILGYSIGQRFNTSIGVLVYNKHMLKNWVETAQFVFGLGEDDVGVVQGDRCDVGRPVTVMMVQSLLARTYKQELYDQIGFIVADEVHHYGAPQWNEVMRQFAARYRLGLSADPSRDDGLDALIDWHFGDIGHKIVARTAKPNVVQITYNIAYKDRAFCTWDGSLNHGEGGWYPNPVRYDKLLAADRGRNSTIVEELVLARSTGRRILIFSRFNDHLLDLKAEFDAEWGQDPARQPTLSTMLIGGLKDDELDEAMAGDVIFTNYPFARDALNLPSIDTLFFATPPGKPLQPIGRLRDKGAADRRALLAVDFCELTPYSQRKAARRRDAYEELQCQVRQVSRNVKRVTDDPEWAKDRRKERRKKKKKRKAKKWR